MLPSTCVGDLRAQQAPAVSSRPSRAQEQSRPSTTGAYTTTVNHGMTIRLPPLTSEDHLHDDRTAPTTFFEGQHATPLSQNMPTPLRIYDAKASIKMVGIQDPRAPSEFLSAPDGDRSHSPTIYEHWRHKLVDGEGKESGRREVVAHGSGRQTVSYDKALGMGMLVDAEEKERSFQTDREIQEWFDASYAVTK